jgi:Fe-Mn family superoxide dismutase
VDSAGLCESILDEVNMPIGTLDNVSYYDVLYIATRGIVNVLQMRRDDAPGATQRTETQMPLELPALPFFRDSLEPFISSTTLETHHGKHHRAYVDRVNALVSSTVLAGGSLEAIVRLSARRAASDPSMVAVFNNAAQAWNHTFYWNSLRRADTSGARGPHGALAARIRTDFGDEAGFAAAFKAAATGHFGSGWAWLVLDGSALRIVTTANADTPIVHGQDPLLVIDVWEHAYYLDYHERRAAYVAGVVENLLNWEFAGRNFELAVKRVGGDVTSPHPAVA